MKSSKSQKPYDVFLSYAKEDRETVKQIYSRLCDEGISVFWDETCLFPGQDWELEIKNAIREAQLVLICLSPVSISKRGFINRELREALKVFEEYPEGTTYLIPVVIEPLNSKKSIPERLKSIHSHILTSVILQ